MKARKRQGKTMPTLREVVRVWRQALKAGGGQHWHSAHEALRYKHVKVKIYISIVWMFRKEIINPNYKFGVSKNNSIWILSMDWHDLFFVDFISGYLLAGKAPSSWLSVWAAGRSGFCTKSKLKPSCHGFVDGRISISWYQWKMLVRLWLESEINKSWSIIDFL